ncbi:PfkB family carbohydrate kinase [Ornithinimicrobium sediminis]|uniref:PfkB family carbohydrate kinase n=1 Tax=Ornithinimicrobium sediminis TaxID=2904603 RepID=UPI001E49BAD0|nr:PfkB family carbohydrate kinase [Ornithinimicrobium sediminis]MCE0485422.1 PfkB family carbohydrate kinase [Ornithinimicrobium sediminis]
MSDVVGIGMINIDYIVDSIQAQRMNPEEGAGRLDSFEYGVERGASEETIKNALQYLGSYQPRISPGGSALNVVASLASTSAPLRVGYVGIRGVSPEQSFDFADWFSVLGIDTPHVYDSQESAGICVSFTRGAERSMLTSSGANQQFEEMVSRNYAQILEYLSGARLVHVTAFAEQREPIVLATLLQELKAKWPAVTITCDPSALWAPVDRPKAVNDILASVDIIIMNAREFDLISCRMPGMSDKDAASECFRLVANLRSVIVVKRYDRIKIFHRVGAEVNERIFQNPHILDATEVVDDTGAGDAFAAGFIGGLCLPGFEEADSVDLGLRLARRKLRFVGMTGIADFRQDFLEASSDIVSRSLVTEAGSGRARVFIGHGRDSEWRHVKDCLEGWGLKTSYFESAPVAGRFASEVLTEQALQADFAVIVVTGDDVAEGQVRGRQNVVHEIGLMQGRLGWTKVAILMEEGVEAFSNIAGLQYLRFGKGRVQHAFHDLEVMLVREGMLRPAATYTDV